MHPDTVPPLLSLAGIEKRYGAVRALQGVDFELRAGEVHALLGENGAGKSTLIAIITGARPADAGTMTLAGRVVAGLDPAAARRLGIACVHQQPALFAELTVAENIGLRLEAGGAWRRVDWRARATRAAELLQRVGAEFPATRTVRELSMPEQQLVEIAAALGMGARIVVMDEPTASLTRREQEKLYGIVRGLRAAGVGVIYISHRLEEIRALADRVTVLRDGQSAGTRAVADVTEPELIRLMVGREVGLTERAPGVAPGAVRLAVEKLGCAAGGVTDVTFEIRAGEILGLAGLVGAGRTELARALFGLTPAETGRILVDGQEKAIRAPGDAIAAGLAYVPEDRRRHGVILEMPIAQNMTMAVHGRLFPGGWLRSGPELALAADYIRDLGIKAAGPDAPGASLSGGNQ
jgi:rhamnose transport system ATP-binding protein